MGVRVIPDLENLTVEEIEERLVLEYLEFFSANDWWNRNRSTRSYFAIRKHLFNIIYISKFLVSENRKIFKSIKEERKNAKQKQNQG